MLRIWVTLSIVIHVVLFSVGSLIASQPARKPPLLEKQFQVNLRKEMLMAAPSPAPSVNDAQPAPVRHKLAASRPVFPASIPPGTKRHVTPQNEKLPILPTIVGDVKKTPADVAALQAHSPDGQDALLNARQLPTPVPSPKPKPAAMPARPKPTPAPPPKQSQPVRSTPLPPDVTATPSVEPTPFLAAGASSRPASSASPTPGTIHPPMSSVMTPVASVTPSSSGSLPDAEPTVVTLDEERLTQYAQKIAANIQRVLKYPAQARRKSWEGTVVMTLHLRPNGQLEQVDVITQTPYQMLNEAALQALTNAQPFPPIDSVPMGQRIIVTIPIEFRLTR